MTDAQIIKRCIKGKRRAQNQLYEKYFPLLSSIAIRYTSEWDTALQYINGGFLKILQNLDRYQEEFALATWMRKILVNHIIDELRKNKTYDSVITLNPTHAEEHSSSSWNEAESNLAIEDLRAMLNDLPSTTKTVFNLFAIDGFKHSEISVALNISIGTSKWHVNQARKLLKHKLMQHQLRDEHLMKKAK